MLIESAFARTLSDGFTDDEWVLILTKLLLIPLAAALYVHFIADREPPVAITDEPKGLGGWLILVCIGLIYHSIAPLISLMVDHLPIFTEAYWNVLTTSGSSLYPTPYEWLIPLVAVNLLIVMLAIQALDLFFKKSRRFPRFFIGYMVFMLVIRFIDCSVSANIHAVGILVADTTNVVENLGVAIIQAFIGINYVRLSQRVKNTFVE